ncbi:hypothetical protein AX16_006134 [Volvariella volvacea WC 439]|nr:hypothetical protein AX16_006134 [Volvariella volvacea WC 439]
MAKQKQNPSPQDLYRARKEREEREKVALLPPGLYNHGNTCFMNSVLQGLIATRLLSDLVHFQPIPPSIQSHSTIPIASRRSPQVTNGHSLAGPYEQPWTNTMPIGDEFLTILWKAWDAQNHRRRESLSPKHLLHAVGQKYDQYLDFAQQDAHEFLRILLDAIRMEEFDIIKKRQPPPDKPRKRRRTVTSHPSHHANDRTTNAQPDGQPSPGPSTPSAPIVEDDRLVSLSDMVFGGQLTSVLVCQKCKYISQTYEDFNDLSLSIKPEDYVHERKRDRLKNLAKKLTSFPSAVSPIPTHPAPPDRRNAVDILRAASVPPQSKPEENKLKGLEEPPIPDNPRRKSFDGTAETAGTEKEKADVKVVVEDVGNTGSAANSGEQGRTASVEKESRGSISSASGSSPPERHVEFLQPGKEDREKEKEKKKEKEKDKESDTWTKLGRRISMTMGLGRSKEKEKERARSKERKSVDLSGGSKMIRAATMEELPTSFSNLAADATPKNVPTKQDVPSITRQAPTPVIPQSTDLPAASAKALKHQSLPVPPAEPATTSTFPSPRFPTIQRSRSPKPPKGTPAEAAYLRRILADVVPASSSHNPFALLKSIGDHHLLGSSPLSQSSSSAGGNSTSTSSSHGHGSSAASYWLGVPSLTGLEECLRMFTAVEVLDGENMVGCRRCWKIANGEYGSPKGGMDDDDEENEEEEQEPKVEVEEKARKDDPRKTGLGIIVPDGPSATLGSGAKSPISHPGLLSSSLNSPTAHIPSSRSTPALLDKPSSSDVEDISPTISVSSLPTDMPVTQAHSDDGHSVPETQRISYQPGSPTASSPTPSRLNHQALSHLSPAKTLRRSSLLSPLPNVRLNGGPIPAQQQQQRIIDAESTDPSSASSSENESESGASDVDSRSSKGHSRSPAGADRGVAGVAGIAGTGGRRATLTGNGAPGVVAKGGDASGSSSQSSLVHIRREEVEGATSDAQKKTDDAPQAASSPNAPPRRPSLKTNTTSQSTATLTPPSSSTTRKTVKSPKSKPKPVIMRPAFKRYLISVPPPVLVVHFKRFQQVAPSNKLFSSSGSSGIPSLPYSHLFPSFSHGFKKLDDYVTFPEYLDLGPYLAPRKEDYGLGSGASGAGTKEQYLKIGKKKEEREKCMYRLYAVVVHIGNMLGGHYVAYTALPSEAAAKAAFASTPPASTSCPPASEPRTSTSNSQAYGPTEPSSSSVSSSSPKSSTTTIESSSSTHSVDSVSTSATSDHHDSSPGKYPPPSHSTATASTPSVASSTTVASSTSTQATTSQSSIPTSTSATTVTSTSTANTTAPTATTITSTSPPKPTHDQTQERQWAYISDTIVKLTSLEEVLKAKAYLCMYERV